MTTGPSNQTNRRRGSGPKAGFSLTELMIALTIGLFVMGAILSALLFMTRSSMAIHDYAEMNLESRRMLETIGRDLRSAMDIAPGFSDSEFLVFVSFESGTIEPVRYSYDPDDPARPLIREMADEERILMTNIEELTFRYYDLQGGAATSREAVKQIQIQLNTVRDGAARRETSERVVSARYILRNKVVGN